MDSSLGSTIEMGFQVDATVAVEFLTHVGLFRSGGGARLVGGGPPATPSAAPPVAPAAVVGPSDAQVRTFWDGLREMGDDHGVVQIVCWWLDHPGHYHRGQIAEALGLYRAQVSNWMRTLRHYLRRAGLPYELYGHSDGMGIDEPYASALRRGRPDSLGGPS
jgi:hypothetical protein